MYLKPSVIRLEVCAKRCVPNIDRTHNHDSNQFSLQCVSFRSEGVHYRSDVYEVDHKLPKLEEGVQEIEAERTTLALDPWKYENAEVRDYEAFRDHANDS